MLPEEISILLKMLVLFGYDEDAGELQVVYGDTLELVHRSVEEIWPTKSEESNSLVCIISFFVF